MKRTGILLLSLALLASVLALFATGAGGQPQSGSNANAYTAAFLCGSFRDSTSAEGPVGEGRYRTAIDVRNPNADPVTVASQAVALFRGSRPRQGSQAAAAPRGGSSFQLAPGSGVQIDCTSIRRALGGSPRAPTFLQGLLTLAVDAPAVLDVVAVTVAGNDGQTTVHEVDRPAAQQVRKTSAGSSPSPGGTGSPRPSPGPTAGPTAGPSPSGGPIIPLPGPQG